MGNTSSVPEKMCIDISHLDVLTQNEYVVERKDGSVQDGWFISMAPHICGAVTSYKMAMATKHGGSENPGVWRIAMHNTSSDPNTHACGWRRVEMIEPTYLDGDYDRIKKWRADTIELLESVSRKHQAAHTVSVGDTASVL
jgi:hypothetical protein